MVWHPLLLVGCLLTSTQILFTLGVSVNGDIFYYQPEQVHLSLGESEQDIVVTWSTFSDAGESIVEYGVKALDQRAKGKSSKFTDGGNEHRAQYIHHVSLTALKPNTTYIYHCGGSLGWSSLFQFRSIPANNAHWSPSFAIYGDMGNENAQSLARLQDDTQRGMYDAILHVGDFAYDMSTQNARIGDEFMRQIESVAAYLPYMVVPGNHEERYNFSNYRARFNMPGGPDSFHYSFDLGPVHFIALNTEAYYFLNYGLKPLAFQYEWLKQDLREANKPENRELRPWIIAFGHRPMYCSNSNDNDCTHSQTLTRTGWPFFHLYALEPLMYEHGVDVLIWAHEHSYERLWPIYDYEVRNGSLSEPYHNARAPVHVVTGSAGCLEGREPFKGVIPAWSAYHTQDYGYTRLKAHNGTHLYFEQVSDDKNGAIIDSFWLSKDKGFNYAQQQLKH